MKPVYYRQNDPRWRSIPYTIDGDVEETIGYSGCGPTSMAMVLATWVDKSITPPDMCTLAIQTGTRTADNGTDWGFFGKVAKKYGLRYKQTYFNADALECINSGGMVICSMGKGRWTRGGHYVLWYGVDGDMVLVNDPQSTAANRSRAPIRDMYAQSKQYFCFWPPEVAAPDNEEDPMAHYIEQIAQKAGCDTEHVITALAVLVKNANINPDAWEQDGLMYLLNDQKLINSNRNANAPVAWGELGVLMKRFVEKYHLK